MNNGVSVVIPTLNETPVINQTLNKLQPLKEEGFELVVVDGGSTDSTVSQVQSRVDCVVLVAKGRARQMNIGANVARGEWLLFLHADTQLPDNIDQWLSQLEASGLSWGFFPLRLRGKHWLFRCIEFAVNQRSRLTRVATGDQCLFVRRQLFEQVGGYPGIPLMEDVALSKKLRAISRPFCWRYPVVTSSRRWEKNGIIKTVLLMWRLRLAYFFGVSPQSLYRAYYD